VGDLWPERARRARHQPPPSAGAARASREDYSARWREVVSGFDHQLETRAYDDPVAERLAAFWRTKRDEIRALVARAEQLANSLRARADAVDDFVLCHADLHPGNLLQDAGGELAIVDWDAPIFAPRERDLMCLGGGVSEVWSDAREEALFYAGYGPITLDPLALAYYRYERIVADLAAYGEQIFGAHGSLEDREHGLRQVMGQFLPRQVVEVAHRTFTRLP
jgi:spectinomycin phosphotransferase